MQITSFKEGTKFVALALAAICAAWIAPANELYAGAPAGSNNTGDKEQIVDESFKPLPYVPGQLVVKLTPGAEISSVVGKTLSVSVAAQLEHSDIYLLNVPSTPDPMYQADSFSFVSGVAEAQPNYLINYLNAVQASYPFSDLQAVGDYGGQNAATLLDVSGAHDLATGSGVTVAVIDGGVDFNHPALGGRATSGYDYVDGDNDAYDEAGGFNSGHGTFVAGVVHLMAPDATIRAYRVTNPRGVGDGFTLARAIERAVDDGCNVINLSLVLLGRHLAVSAAADYAEGQNVLVVGAAGNQTVGVPIYPAAEPTVLAVTAVDSNRLLTAFSNYGEYVDVVAPGVSVYSAYQNDLFAWWSGTSFAAPFAAGLAVLLVQVDPAASASDFRLAITQAATGVDNLNPLHTGKLGRGLLNPVLSLTLMTSTETADVTPDTVRYTYPELYFPAVLERDSVWLSSTNAPAAFTAHVEAHSLAFIYVEDSAGTTNRWARFLVNPLPFVGTHINRVVFEVDGVLEPAILTAIETITPSDDTTTRAWVEPISLYFSARLHTEILYSGTALLSSTNAPAAFTGYVLEGGAGFTTLLDSAGMTNDSVRVTVDPSLAPAVGLYADSVVFQVDGAANVVVLPVYVQIYDDSIGTGDTAAIIPSGLQAFVATEGVPSVQSGCRVIYSTNAPASYFAEVIGTPMFTSLLDSVGFTNDSLCYEISNGSLPAGIYYDTVVVTVEGTDNSPLIAINKLTVQSAGGGEDSAHVAPDTLWFTYNPDSLILITGRDSAWLSSTNAPAAYTGYMAPDSLQFAHLEDSVGSTNGWVHVFIDPMGTPGTYVNTAVFDVAGTAAPVFLTVIQNVTTDTVIAGDTAAVLPSGPQIFTAQEGAPGVQTGCRVIYSTNAPANYVVGVYGSPQFTTIIGDTSGMTNDSVCYEVSGSGFPAGTYENTLNFYVNGASNNPVTAIVRLIVEGDSTGGAESASVSPTSLAFSAMPGSTTPRTANVFLSSTNAPASYFAFAVGGSSSFVSVPDSAGVTNDSVLIVADPTGLPFGFYVDTVVFEVSGAPNPVYLFVSMNLDDTSLIVTAVRNYPNPFNPQTEIAFSIASEARVRLDVINIIGEIVNTLVDRRMSPGEHRVLWTGTDGAGREVASGVYFYRLRADEVSIVRKMLLLR
jgi:thermitase